MVNEQSVGEPKSPFWKEWETHGNRNEWDYNLKSIKNALFNITDSKTLTLYCIVFVKCQPNPGHGSPFPCLFASTKWLKQTNF